MIDQTSQFFAILTNIGVAKQANADALGIAWKITQMGVGDANGTEPIPSATQTALINERRRAPLNQLKVDPANSAIIIAEQVIPEDVGGWWIREIGLYDADGDLVAIANCAPSFKPLLTQGSGRTQVVRMNMIVSNSSNVELKIDPSVVLATRAYVDGKVLEELNKLDSKQSVLVATTANIALAGLQTIDGVAVPAGARVLVKNQTVAKDNGIYIAAAPAWTRAPDADTNAEVTSALLTSVEQGTTLADTRWQLVTDGLIVVGTTALTFQNVTQGFAPINAPALINPTANTPPLFDNGLALATTEFVRRAGGNYRGFTNATASAVLTTAAVGTLVTCIGAFTLTMPAANTVPSGGAIHFRNIGNAVVTVSCAGADTINAGNGNQPTSIDLQPGATLELTGNGANAWWAAGSAQLQFSKVFSSTPAQFDNSKLLVNSEFVKKAGTTLSGFSTYNVSATLPNSVAGSATEFYGTTAGQTLILPLAAAARVTDVITLFNYATVAVTISKQGAESIFLGANSTANSLLLQPGDSLLLAAGGTQWYVIGGTGANQFSASFGSSLGAGGYQKLPSGLILQWAHPLLTAAGTSQVFSFPMAFPNGVLSVMVTHDNAGAAASQVNKFAATAVNASTYRVQSDAPFAASAGAFMLSIGS
mgnify:CR=1 FL=1